MLRRVVAIAMGAACAVTLVGAPADAASTTQKICSSKGSKVEFDLDYSPNHIDTVYIGQCYPKVPKGTVVDMSGVESYQVGYGGPYSECRQGRGSFVPYQKATSIYFKTFYNRTCCT